MKTFIGFEEALRSTLSRVPVLEAETVPLERMSGRVLARDLFSKVDNPSADVSLKDGFAVRSDDLPPSEKGPSLSVRGAVAAGFAGESTLSRGEAVRIATGAPLPSGSDAVLSEEFADRRGESILCLKRVRPGQNVLKKGADIRAGERAARKGEQLTPALIGLLASAGLREAEVHRAPRVAVIGTGDELTAPGLPLERGRLYASNAVEICAWLSLFKIPFQMDLAGDEEEAVVSILQRRLPDADAFVTSGGVWGSERDLMIQILERLGWEKAYHRVRMGPGKAVAFGLLEGRPFFCLPGGPPSNEMAFLQLALPAILAMQGIRRLPFPTAQARLEEEVRGERSWTQFIHAGLSRKEDALLVRPKPLKSRLQSMARKEALIVIPEGRETLKKTEQITIQLMTPLVQPQSPIESPLPLHRAESVFSPFHFSG